MVFFVPLTSRVKEAASCKCQRACCHPRRRALALSTWLAKSADYTGHRQDKLHNGRHWQASSMIEGGRWYTLRYAAGQVTFAFWGGIDWKPVAFAKGLGRAGGEGRIGGL